MFSWSVFMNLPYKIRRREDIITQPRHPVDSYTKTQYFKLNNSLLLIHDNTAVFSVSFWVFEPLGKDKNKVNCCVFISPPNIFSNIFYSYICSVFCSNAKCFDVSNEGVLNRI